MKVIVTGANGLIGSHLSKALHEAGHEVYGIDDFSTTRQIDNVPEYFEEFFDLDLLEKDGVDFVFEKIKPETVFHCAAWAHEGLAQFSPTLIVENNINIAMNTLVSSIRHGMKRFSFISSIAVYGDQEPPFTEETPKNPTEIYGACKSFIEDAIKSLAKVHGFEYTIFRCYNVFGEGQATSDPYRNVVAILMNNILKEMPISIYGDGEQKRSFTYIEDIIKPIVLGSLTELGKDQILNLGDDRVYTLNQLITSIGKAVGKEINPEHLPGRVSEAKFAYCDNTKAKELVALSADSDFDEAIRRTWLYTKELGPQDYRYLEEFEIPSPKIPKNYYKS